MGGGVAGGDGQQSGQQQRYAARRRPSRRVLDPSGSIHATPSLRSAPHPTAAPESAKECLSRPDLVISCTHPRSARTRSRRAPLRRTVLVAACRRPSFRAAPGTTRRRAQKPPQRDRTRSLVPSARPRRPPPASRPDRSATPPAQSDLVTTPRTIAAAPRGTQNEPVDSTAVVREVSGSGRLASACSRRSAVGGPACRASRRRIGRTELKDGGRAGKRARSHQRFPPIRSRPPRRLGRRRRPAAADHRGRLATVPLPRAQWVGQARRDRPASQTRPAQLSPATPEAPRPPAAARYPTTLVSIGRTPRSWLDAPTRLG